MPKHQRSRLVLFSLAPIALASCLGYRTPMLDPNQNNPSSPAPKDAQPGLGSDTQLASVCQVEKHYVLVLGDDGQLYRFDADTLTLTSLAKVSCSNTLNSMTVSPMGPAYISSQFGDLCLVDTRTFKAPRTAFNPLLIAWASYGMALLPDTTVDGQTLYIAVMEGASSAPDHLERVDLSTFGLTSIGYLSPPAPSAELTAGPNGELYGFAVGTSESLLLNIDPATAAAIDVTRVPAGFANGAFALVYWQDAFYLFLGSSNGSSSTVYRYRKGDAQVTTIGSVSAVIIGAGVACAND
jgi:hypothetical protein